MPLFDQIREAGHEFADAMDDDFSTPRALAALHKLTTDINTALEDAGGALEQSLVNAVGLAGETLRRLGSVLGGLFESLEESVSYIAQDAIDMSVPIIDLPADKELVRKSIECRQPLPKEAIDRIVRYRNQLRHQKDWAKADGIRTWLADLGVVVDDTADGVRWYVKAAQANP